MHEIKTDHMKLLLVTIAFIALATALLGVKVFFVKGGRFPNSHIHGNKAMRDRGITCARDKDFTF